MAPAAWDAATGGAGADSAVVKGFVQGGFAAESGGGPARGLSVDELGREHERRSAAYSRARGVL